MYRGKSAMQREIPISGHESPADQWRFPDEYDFDTSLYRSILPAPKNSLHLDHHLNDAACISPPIENLPEESIDFASYWNQIQEQQMHQELMDRHQRILSQLREVAKQAQSLRQENVNLKMASLDLNNRLNLLLSTTPFHAADFGSGLNGPMKMGSVGIGADEEGTNENEAVAKSPTSVMDSGRVQLPKSISVRSSGYLKSGRAGGKGGDCVRASNRNRFDSATQKVYLKGGEKEKLELEVYNQGMLKTELCNKWQQTGECRYGDNCQFAHGIDELRPIIRHPRYKTEVCRMMLKGVPCPYGHRCHFRHTLTDVERLALETNYP